jgi:hypothetical protein
MTLTLFPLILFPDLSKLSLPNVDLTVFTVLGPYHILKMLFTTQPSDQMAHNLFSLFWQQHNHPEYPYTNKTPDILHDINPGEFSPECSSNGQTTQSFTCNSPLTPSCHSHNGVNAAIEDYCKVIRYTLTKPQITSRHNAFLSVFTCRLSLLPKNNLEIAPATSYTGNPDLPLDSDKIYLETAGLTKNSPISATPALFLLTLLHKSPRKLQEILNNAFHA